MKTMILAISAVLALSVGASNAMAASYHAPAHNFYQNNWMSNGS